LLAVVAVTGAVYLPSLTNGFVGLDDDVYITANPLIASFSAANLSAILTRPYAEFYHPVTLLSLAFDRLLWGFNAFGYHLTDWIIHLLNTALVFWLCYHLVSTATSNTGAAWCAPTTGQSSRGAETQDAAPVSTGDLARVSAGIAAALFGLHPLHVESVAWAAQRKDLLCSLFYLLAFVFYLRYAQRREAEGAMQEGEGNSQLTTRNWYRASLAAFVLALLAKAMALTLPLVLVLVDIYPLRRLRGPFTGRMPVPPMAANQRSVWIEKMPFLGLAVAATIVTIAAQAQGGSIRSTAEIPWQIRPWLVIHSYSFYLWKAILPRDLTVLYPIPLWAGVRDVGSWIGSATLVAITVVVWLARRRRPVLAATWAYYVITLAPVCGLLTFGAQSVADRYSYLPLLGPFLLVGLAIGRINQIGDRGLRPSLRTLAGIGAGLALVACASVASRQIAHWHNGESLWSDHLQIFPDNARACFNLGHFYHTHGYPRKAKEEYERSLELQPRYFEAHINLGDLFLREGDAKGAADCFRKAIEERPNHAGAHYNMGLALVRLNRLDEATECFKQSVTLDPRNADARASLGQALAESGNLGAAIREYRAALSLNPRLATVHENLGFAYLTVNEIEQARREFERTVYLQPRSPDSLIELGRLDAASSQPLRALGRLSRAAHYRPRDPEIHWLRAKIMWDQGALGLAESLFRQAINLDPENAESHIQLGLFLEKTGRCGEALEALTEAWSLLQDADEPVPETLAETLRRVDAQVKAVEGEK